ncbi:helix-turn-helix domain-containing protein [Paludibacter sp.]|uniref:helix-turn-helix domain-containing protein n=1 Tax=Paludibacter sp. TaxID=1898105 RepID=UPI0025F61069|nr:helix-turn-helix domain-containing protein [Paludibacter sp.]
MEITFDQLPNAVGTLIAEVRALKSKLEQQEKVVKHEDRWLNIDELQEYLPDHPAKATIYGWVCSRRIPCHKSGKRLRFLQSEIDEYLMLGKRKTISELMIESTNARKNK